MLETFYRKFVTDELEKLIPKGSFASYLTRSIGWELQDMIEYLDEVDEDGSGFWGSFPVQELYNLLASGWSLDHEELRYTDDNENEIPLSVPRTYSAVEQIAAYGLYWVSVKINVCGQFPDTDFNVQGWTREGVIEHKAECLIRAYQALVCGQKLMIGNPSVSPATREKIEKSARIAMARKAADALHNKPNGVRAKKTAVIAYWSKSIGADKSNEFAAELLQKEFPGVAHRTLARYISEAKKSPPAGTL